MRCMPVQVSCCDQSVHEAVQNTSSSDQKCNPQVPSGMCGRLTLSRRLAAVSTRPRRSRRHATSRSGTRHLAADISSVFLSSQPGLLCRLLWSA